MEFVLDIRTFSFANGAMAFTMFLCMLHVTIRRRIYPGFQLWAWAALANSTGFILLSLRHLLPVEGTVIVANWLIALAAVLICRGLIRFSGKSQTNWLDISALVIIAALFTQFAIFQPSVNARIFFISLFLALFYLRAALLALGPVARLLRQQNVLLASSLILLGVWFLARSVVSGIWESLIIDFMTAGYWHGLTFLAFMVGNTTVMVGLLSVNSCRMEIDLTSASEEIKSLKGIIPICASCKKIRDDQGYWQMVETYMEEHTGAEFTHGICPDCMTKLYPDLDGAKKNEPPAKGPSST